MRAERRRVVYRSEGVSEVDSNRQLDDFENGHNCDQLDDVIDLTNKRALPTLLGSSDLNPEHISHEL